MEANAIRDDGTTRVVMHKFERAGLGKAPFRVVGYERKVYVACPGAPAQPGGTCDFCGQGIMDVFAIRSADGRVFDVGSDCVRKTGDAGLRVTIEGQVAELRRARDRERRALAAERTYAEIRDLLADERLRAALADRPHPQRWRADKGETALDQATWLAANCGAQGHRGLLSWLRREQAALAPTAND